MRKLTIENIETHPIETKVEFDVESFDQKPGVEILGRVQEFSSYFE